MKTIISGGTIVNEGRVFDADIIISDGRILEVTDHHPEASYDECIDAWDATYYQASLTTMCIFVNPD